VPIKPFREPCTILRNESVWRGNRPFQPPGKRSSSPFMAWACERVDRNPGAVRLSHSRISAVASMPPSPRHLQIHQNKIKYALIEKCPLLRAHCWRSLQNGPFFSSSRDASF